MDEQTEETRTVLERLEEHGGGGTSPDIPSCNTITHKHLTTKQIIKRESLKIQASLVNDIKLLKQICTVDATKPIRKSNPTRTVERTTKLTKLNVSEAVKRDAKLYTQLCRVRIEPRVPKPPIKPTTAKRAFSKRSRNSCDKLANRKALAKHQRHFQRWNVSANTCVHMPRVIKGRFKPVASIPVTSRARIARVMTRMGLKFKTKRVKRVVVTDVESVKESVDDEFDEFDPSTFGSHSIFSPIIEPDYFLMNNNLVTTKFVTSTPANGVLRLPVIGVTTPRKTRMKVTSGNVHTKRVSWNEQVTEIVYDPDE